MRCSSKYAAQRSVSSALSGRRNARRPKLSTKSRPQALASPDGSQGMIRARTSLLAAACAPRSTAAVSYRAIRTSEGPSEVASFSKLPSSTASLGCSGSGGICPPRRSRTVFSYSTLVSRRTGDVPRKIPDGSRQMNSCCAWPGPPTPAPPMTPSQPHMKKSAHKHDAFAHFARNPQCIGSVLRQILGFRQAGRVKEATWIPRKHLCFHPLRPKVKRCRRWSCFPS